MLRKGDTLGANGKVDLDSGRGPQAWILGIDRHTEKPHGRCKGVTTHAHADWAAKEVYRYYAD